MRGHLENWESLRETFFFVELDYQRCRDKWTEQIPSRVGHLNQLSKGSGVLAQNFYAK